MLSAAFTAAGIKSDIQNAKKDVNKFGTICDSMVTQGVKVLLIVNLDSNSGSACLKKAQAAGIKTIDYDRLTLGGGASYYVSFDNVAVGKLMGDGLTKCLTDMGKKKAKHRDDRWQNDGQQRGAVQAGLRCGAQAEGRRGRLQDRR